MNLKREIRISVAANDNRGSLCPAPTQLVRIIDLLAQHCAEKVIAVNDNRP